MPSKAEPEPRGLSDKERSRFEAVFQQPWLDRVPKRKRGDDVEKNVIEDSKNRLVRDRAIVFLMMYAGPRVDETYKLNISRYRIEGKVWIASHSQG